MAIPGSQTQVVALASPRRGLPVEIADATGPPKGLVPYALLLVGAALTAVVVGGLAFPVQPTISVDGGSSPSGISVALGVAFWILFGFVGSVRPRGLAGGAVITFHMPFVIAGTILGGPLVGALMGVISLTEVRELRRVPWYGVLANHAICVLAAAVAGIAGAVSTSALAEAVAVSDAVHRLLVGMVIALTFVAANLILVLPVIALRTGSEFAMVVRRTGSALRATLVAELTLGWLMAVTYLSVAWWAPLVCVIVILAVWDAHDRREALRRDPMTGLLNDAGVQPLLEEALEEARRRCHRHAILFIDLDRFGKLNKQHGSDVGDDVIRAVALRMAAAVRSTDVVGRQNRAGDEFLILLRDLTDEETATRLAWRLHDTILRPVRVRGDTLVVSVGASIGVAMIAPGTTDSLEEIKRMADARMQEVKRGGGGVQGSSDAQPP